MTTPATPPAPTPWLTRRLLVVAGLGLFLTVGVALKAFWPTAIIAPPALDLTGVDPAAQRLIEERLAEVRNKPTSADAWGTLAIVLDNNRFEQGLKCFEQAERLDPSNPRWPHFQGIAFLRIDPDAAVPRFQRAAQLGSDGNPASRLRLAELYLRLGRMDEARGQFEILLKVDAHHPPAHLGLARLDFHAGKLVQSRGHLGVPLAHPLTAKAALLLSAEIDAREGKSDAARQALAQSIELPKPRDWPDPFVKEALQYNVGESALVQKAEALCEMKRLAEAVKLLQDVVREYPDSKAGWNLLGFAQIQQGQFASAEKSLQTAVKIDPENAQPLMYLGFVRFNLKDRPGAKDYFRRALAKKPDLIEAHFNLAQCLKDEGDGPGAIETLHTAVRCQPYSARAHVLLGELLVEHKRADEAAFHLQEAITLNPSLGNAKKLLEDVKQKQAKAKKS